ncbi:MULTISPECIES: hypothetical protein [Chryseobacterium]|uniref:DUF4397 domain-containing protein n=1 Tax=Chryseobacterium geocarposphaerae TaxID=1416776 RepID=A0ABU1LIF0_9FLAO|nr:MULTISPECIES: hypothetical protein [Chryseobacterium]MDR6406513.1 hypothetical protein [Chryseobacterium geocarposphaerae]MDR6699988.1 hypothetical protein [Chryseobacterium ginsenosidimutans]
MRKNNVLFLVFVLSNSFLFAQVGIGTASPNINAILELNSSNKGLILPKVALTATNNAAPLTAHVAGMTVYNTATNTSSAANAVYPGEYYNDGTKWMRKVTVRETRMIAGGTISDQISSKTLTVPDASNYVDTTLLTLPSFTLDRESIVEFNANVSADFTKNDGSPLTDSSAKLAKAYFIFTSAPSGVPTNTQFGSSSQAYTNTSTTNSNIISGYFYLVPHSILNLPAGSYTVALKGGGASDTGYKLTFGNGSSDMSR